jgi:hypothetical protein
MDRPRYEPIEPARLAAVVASRLAAAEVAPALRVAVDGPRAAAPDAFAGQLVVSLRTLGRPTVVVDARTFWRDASLRFEWGREDVEAYARTWLDAEALRREVLDPLGPGGSGRYLPALRDPDTNRSVRVAARTAPDHAVVLVAGDLLLGRGLPFDLTVHLDLDPAARQRRSPDEWRWTLPAYDAYERDVRPADQADVVVRLNDLRHPAIRFRPSST